MLIEIGDQETSEKRCDLQDQPLDEIGLGSTRVADEEKSGIEPAKWDANLFAVWTSTKNNLTRSKPGLPKRLKLSERFLSLEVLDTGFNQACDIRIASTNRPRTEQGFPNRVVERIVLSAPGHVTEQV